MIKITMNELLNVVPVLRELSTKTFKGCVTFKIARLMRELDKEVLLFEDSRYKLAEKYGIRKEDNSLDIGEDGTIKIQENKLQECNEEMMALLNTEIEINADKIPFQAFDNIDLTLSQAIIIETFLEN